MKRTIPALLMIPLFAGCPSIPATSGDTDDLFTDRMRDACPALPDEALAGYAAAVDRLREDGLSEEDALAAWTQGCDAILPEGNFQGDVQACRDCLSVIVHVVYSGG